MTPIVNFHQLHIVKTGRIALFLEVGFARVAIKNSIRLSKSCMFFISRSNTGTGVLSSPAVAIKGLQTRSQTYRELVATAIDCRRPACNRYSAFPMTDYSPSLMYHAEIIDIPIRAAR